MKMSSGALNFYPFLKISSSSILSKFLHECVDDLIGCGQVLFDKYNSDVEWTLEDYNIAKETIKTFYTQCAVNENYELNVSDLAKNVQTEIENCYNLRREDILQAVIEGHILENGHNYVQSFDWKLKWVLGSSKLASLRESVLQIDLNCVQEGHDKKNNTISFEMDSKGLDNLINELEKVCEACFEQQENE